MIRYFRTDQQAEFFAACLRVTDCELCTVSEVESALKKQRQMIYRELQTNDVRAWAWKGVMLISLSDWMMEYEQKKMQRADAAAAAILEAVATQDTREAERGAALEDAVARHMARTEELSRQDA